MKVIWITSNYPSDQRPGVGVFHETQVQALKALGVDVTVICPEAKQLPVIRLLKRNYRQISEKKEVEVRNGIRVFRPNYVALPGQLRWAQPDKRIAIAVLETIAQHGLDADVLHAHFAMPAGGATRYVAEKLQLPWVLTLHGSDVNVYPHYSPSAKRVFKQTVEEATRVIAVAKELQEKTVKLTGRKANLLPIGVNLARFHVKGNTSLTKQSLRLPENKKIITFVGRLTEEKGINELLYSLEYLPPDVAIVFIGEGPLKGKILSHHAYGERLFITGQIANEQVKSYLLVSDALALPSYTEGMPTVVIEALSMKIPVIATNVGSLAYLYGEYAHTLIKPRDARMLAEAIEKMWENPETTNCIVEALYQKVRTEYDANTNIKSLIAYYKEICFLVTY